MTDSSRSSSGVSLADAIDVGMPPTWPEAVAIVRQLLFALDRGTSPVLVPGLSELYILPAGDMAVGAGQADSAGPVAAVGRLLGELLDRSQPPQGLRDVQRQAVDVPPVFTSLAELANALAFFARPNPESELAAFYARVAPVIEARPRDEALAALKEKTRTAEKPGTPIATVDPKRRRKQIIAAGLVAVGALLLWALQPVIDRFLMGPGAGAVTSVRATVGNVASAAREATAALVGTPTPPADSTTPVPAASPAPVAPVDRRRPAPATKGRSSSTGVGAPTVGAGRETGAGEVAPPLPTPIEARVNAGTYSASDAEVQAPVLVHPQMPSRRVGGHPADRPGELELLVLEDGTVGESRLIPASNRLQDRMLISAAKAWRFTPASRNGEPVRYRLRMPITW